MEGAVKTSQADHEVSSLFHIFVLELSSVCLNSFSSGMLINFKAIIPLFSDSDKNFINKNAVPQPHAKQRYR